MLQIDDKIISLDVIEKQFVCDLDKCKGACCIHGDSGAPLDQDELLKIDEAYPIVQPLMTEKGIDAVERQGTYTIDQDGDYVTPLVDNKECAYVIFENGIAKCSIEKAYFDKLISFRKPVSCHLYPIRIKKFEKFDGVNYDKNEICKPACKIGEELKVPVYVFVKDALIRKYGKEWYEKLEYAAKNLKISRA
jgi:uncharacterized protein DUF3109